jgi:hypothetical protein
MFSFLLSVSNTLSVAMTAITPSEVTESRIWKRRYEALEQQLALDTAPKAKKLVTHLLCHFITNPLNSVTQGHIYAGRALRRVVTLFDHIRDLIEENDRRVLIEIETSEGGDIVIDSGLAHTKE